VRTDSPFFFRILFHNSDSNATRQSNVGSSPTSAGRLGLNVWSMPTSRAADQLWTLRVESTTGANAGGEPENWISPQQKR
jgi:hypothetical protein